MWGRRKDKKLRNRTALFVSVTMMIVGVFAGLCPFVSKADDISALKSGIEQKQQEIKEAENQKKQLQAGLTNVQTIIKDLEKSKSSLAAYVSELDANLLEIQTKIANLSEMIDIKEAEIVETKAELDAAIIREEEQYEAMKLRIKNMYERGNDFYLEILFSAKSFGDMLNRADYVQEISASDRRILEQFQLAREYVEVCKTQLESEQALLEEAKRNVEAEEASLESLIAEKEAEIKAYEADINNREKLVKEYEAEIAAQNAELKALEDAANALQKQLEQANGKKNTYDGGMFVWPAPSYTRISSEYGSREHPTLHVPDFHNGLDIAAPGGSPILAAYDGTVVAAAYSSTMGNYVMINHGDELYTVYMHASALYVSQGQQVTKGQKIAAVGTTGRSTGNHLHFGVRLNGSYVNPWKYLK